MLLPLQGAELQQLLPRALPWARSFCPFRACREHMMPVYFRACREHMGPVQFSSGGNHWFRAWSILRQYQPLEILWEFLTPFCMKPKCHSTSNDCNSRINHYQSFHILYFPTKLRKINVICKWFNIFLLIFNLKETKKEEKVLSKETKKEEKVLSKETKKEESASSWNTSLSNYLIY